MKTRNLLSFLLILSALFIGACSDSAEKPAEKFTADGETFNLKTAKLYLTNSSNYSNENGSFIYRDYIITDGTYVSGNGWNLENYTDATYFFAFETFVPNDNEFVAGNYPSVHSIGTILNNAIYFYGETTEDGSYYESTNGETPNFKISGAMEDGETMTIKFSGGLSHWKQNEIWTETEFMGSLFITAKVEDVRGKVVEVK